MSILIKNWSMADWKELLHQARVGANNAMIGEFTEVEELPPHGDLIDRSELIDSFDSSDFWNPSAEDNCFAAIHVVNSMPAIIERDGK